MVFADYDVCWLHVSTVITTSKYETTEMKNRLSSYKKHKTNKQWLLKRFIIIIYAVIISLENVCVRNCSQL